jgi:protein involved in polysaccharide export with SLBB domain
MTGARREGMMARKIISLVLVVMFLVPPPSGWGQVTLRDQRLEDQARFYLQRVGPTPPSPGELPSAIPTPPPTPAPEAAKVLTVAPRQAEETSAVEKRAADFGLPVKQFGYSFFYKPPETFLPVQAVPVGPDYVIGPGDTVRIVVWGNIQGEYSLTVDRNGTIAVPKVGVIHVSGLNYRHLQEVMQKEFARLYTNFQMNVTLDNLRTIQVYVVGQARFPGSYAVSSLSTLVSALFASGGPSKTGSLRHIQVRRRGKVIAHFDMYDFLIKGDKSKDIRLQSEDVIFIPPIGPVAAIGSPLWLEVTPEMADKLKAAKIWPEARGPGPTAPKVEVTPELAARLKAAKIWPEARGPAPMAPTEMADRLEAGKLPPEARGPAPTAARAEVGGPVKVPGIYELKHERTLQDLLQLAGGLADTAFKGRVQVLRIRERRETVMFEDDLGKLLAGRLPEVLLVDGDFVKIFPVPDLVEKKVRVVGALKTTGEFGLYDNMRVKDLINYAGGLLMEANQEEAEITRINITPQGPETTRIYFSPRRALAGYPRDNLLLKPNDYLFFRTVPEWDLYQLVQVDGEVKFPGTYAIKKGETLSSLLARSGGFGERAYPKGAFFTRVAVKTTQAQHLKAAIDRIETEMLALAAQKTAAELTPEEAKRQEVFVKQQQALLAKLREITPLGRVVIHLDDPERLRGTPGDIELQKGDYLMVPQVQQSVNVLGAVANPTAIIYEPDLRVKDYIIRAGGATRIADPKSTYVIKVNGAALSRRSVKWFGTSWTGSEYVFSIGGFDSMRLDPGDSIVVPEELERIAWLREIKDIATVLGNIAMMAGVVLVGLK